MSDKPKWQQAPTYDEALHQWLRHHVLHVLVSRHKSDVVMVNPAIARTLRRDGYLIEMRRPGAWEVTSQGVAACNRWGAAGPGVFRYPA